MRYTKTDFYSRSINFLLSLTTSKNEHILEGVICEEGFLNRLGPVPATKIQANFHSETHCRASNVLYSSSATYDHYVNLKVTFANVLVLNEEKNTLPKENGCCCPWKITKQRTTVEACRLRIGAICLMIERHFCLCRLFKSVSSRYNQMSKRKQRRGNLNFVANASN